MTAKGADLEDVQTWWLYTAKGQATAGVVCQHRSCGAAETKRQARAQLGNVMRETRRAGVCLERWRASKSPE